MSETPRPIPATISKHSSLLDGTLRLTIDCQELRPEDTAEIFSHVRQLGYFYFHPKPFQEVTVPDKPMAKKQGQTPSQRLRNTLWRAWEQHGGENGTGSDFDAFYEEKMRGLTEWVKDKYLD